MDPDIHNAHKKFLMVLGILAVIVSIPLACIDPKLLFFVLIGALLLWLVFWFVIGFMHLFVRLFY